MLRLYSRPGALLAVVLAIPICAAQPTPEPVWDTEQGPQTQISPSRLAAGVRAYPAGALRALLTIAEEPLLLRQITEEPEALQNPEQIDPPIDPMLLGAIRELQNIPELIAIAAAYPAELAALRELYDTQPEQIEARIAELRGRYELARLHGAAEWQQALQRDPRLIEQYRTLLKDFVTEQVQQYPQFPYVQVVRGEYLLAAPPSDLIMAYVQARGDVPAELKQALETWFSRFAPWEIDRRVLEASGPPDFEPRPEILAAAPPEQRAQMWRLADPGTDVTTLEAVLPVIMQPLPDQPREAQIAYAVAEHARLWVPSDAMAAVTRPEIIGREELEASQQPGYLPPETAPPVYAPAEPVQPGYYQEQGTEYYPAEEPPYIESPAYVETPIYDYGPPSVTEYNVYYTSAAPYYYSYPWTWPVIYSYGLYPYGYDYPYYSVYPYSGVYYGGYRAGIHLYIGGGRYARYYYPTPYRHGFHRYYTHYRHSPWRDRYYRGGRYYGSARYYDIDRYRRDGGSFRFDRDRRGFTFERDRRDLTLGRDRGSITTDRDRLGRTITRDRRDLTNRDRLGSALDRGRTITRDRRDLTSDRDRLGSALDRGRSITRDRSSIERRPGSALDRSRLTAPTRERREITRPGATRERRDITRPSITRPERSTAPRGTGTIQRTPRSDTTRSLVPQRTAPQRRERSVAPASPLRSRSPAAAAPRTITRSPRISPGASRSPASSALRRSSPASRSPSLMRSPARSGGSRPSIAPSRSAGSRPSIMRGGSSRGGSSIMRGSPGRSGASRSAIQRSPRGGGGRTRR